MTDVRSIEVNRVDHTDKQHLMWLKNNGYITKLQLRMAARELDRHGSLDATLEMLATGLTPNIEVDPESPDNLPKLGDVDQDASPKQQLIELRNAGSLSPVETRKAAQSINQGRTLSQALVDAGAHRLLSTIPGPPVQDDPEPEEEDDAEPDAPEEDPEAEDNAPPTEASITEPAESKPAVGSVGELLTKGAKEVVKTVKGIKVKAAVLNILELEVNDRARVTVIRETAKRALELEASDEEVARILNPEDHPDPMQG